MTNEPHSSGDDFHNPTSSDPPCSGLGKKNIVELSAGAFDADECSVDVRRDYRNKSDPFPRDRNTFGCGNRIEGSADGIDWQEYSFRWKPGDVSRPPGLNTPHQPRLDWQMWFEALRLEQVHAATGTIDPRYMSPWFQSFLSRLMTGQPEVVRLLAENPFPNQPPKFIRIALDQYRFTTFAETRQSGDWWHRERVWTGPGWSVTR